jgi:hypothetical protein
VFGTSNSFGYNAPMPNKPIKKRAGRTQARRSNISFAPLTMDQAVDAIFAIKPEDVRKVLASKPGKGKKS